jgi:hypothetical protein
MERQSCFSVQQIKYEFLLYMKSLGGKFDEWYVGCASDPESTLLREHNAAADGVPWIYKPAVSARATQTIVRYFTGVLHTDGADPERIPEGATYAFLFRKSPETWPPARCPETVVP